MRQNIWSIIFVSSIFVKVCSLDAEGFVEGTLVHTQYGCIPIEKCKVGENVIVGNEDNYCPHVIVYINRLCIDSHVKIHVDGDCLQASQDQKFYVISQNKWMEARDLQPLDSLLCKDEQCVFVQSIEIIDEKQTLYAFSIDTNHTFCVGHYGVVAHNIEPGSSATMIISLAATCPPAAAVVAVTEIVAFGIAGLIMYCAHKKLEKNKKNYGGCFAPQDEISKLGDNTGGNSTGCYPAYPIENDPVVGCGIVDGQIKTIEIIPHEKPDGINDICTFPIEIVEPSILCATATPDEGKENRQYGGPWYNRTEDWINEHPFGQKIKKSLERSQYTNQGKRAFKVVKKIEKCDGFNKGDYVVIDALHKDHLEVFDKRGNWIRVADFDGTKNDVKTKQGEKEYRGGLE